LNGGASFISVPSAASHTAPEVSKVSTSSSASSSQFPSQAVGAAAVVTAGLVSKSCRRPRQTQVARQFFGDSGSTSSYRAFDPADQAGVQDPVGFWDPLGLSADKDEATFKRRRAVEIKHGRISMYATIGYIVPEYFKFPGYLSPSLDLKFTDVPNGLAALSKLPVLGGAQIVAFAGLIETTGFFQAKSTTDGRGPREGAFSMKDSTEAAEPGNYGIGFPNFLGKVEDPEARKTKLAAELANGRLAMVAIIGMFFQDGLTGSAWGDWALYTASPLRTGLGPGPGYETLPEFEKPKSGFEGLIGDQEPLGFWDPVGFAADQNLENFKRRRTTELKHGRVSMFATIGYIVPEYFKLDGELSPSTGLNFADVPNGLKALSVVPAAGWAQIVAFVGFIEVAYNKETGEPGNYGKGFLGLGSLGLNVSIQENDSRIKKLGAELANGRLAMVAIIGMFFQDGLTGSAWGDWALYTDSPLRAYENETGVQPPVGFWDPIGLAADGNASDFKRRREVELKHGRISMFATIGYIVPEYFRFPGFLSPSLGLKFADMPNGLAAFSKLPVVAWAQMLTFAGLIEVSVYNEQINDEPGNYGAGFLGVRSVGIMSTGFDDPEVRKKKLNAELANGRLAMMAIIGMFFQDGLTGSAWGDWSNYADSPLRAFEEELGVQAPVGFWDPVGYTRDGNVETFKRRRETEIKHGRVAMYATVGYITPEFFKWPGFLSPSTGLSFEDVPNGLAAISKVPPQGWSQIVAFAGYYELFVYKYNGTPGDYGWKAITSTDPETLKSKLNAEIANGRLAMMAIIGMFFQDGLTGSAWGDWSNYTDSPLR